MCQGGGESLVDHQIERHQNFATEDGGEVFEDFAQRVVSGDGFAHRVLETIQKRKRNKEIEKLSETDIETLFDAIEDNQSYEG